MLAVLLLGSGAAAPNGAVAPWSHTTPRWTLDGGPATSAIPASNPVSASLSISPSQVQKGQSISVTTTASGGTPPYTSYSYTGLPGGCSGQNQASFSCNPSSTGSFSVQVTVTDMHGNQSTPGNTVSVDITSSSNGNGNGNGGGNNSSGGLSSLFSGFSGILSLLLIFGIVGFITWILLLVGVWIIAITLVRRLPKRGVAGAVSAFTKCPACSTPIPVGTKFCSECGTSTAPKVT
ncbi:MAG: zinc ribbon domain-containing protein [Thermoplasmata archaeon]|nr:zinc ribbon domain-containing protein [Thermoplasmata archaeon]MCI4356477.1 zinc ribbon domain-containing protein [Thermoplasmata archaeon]